MFVLTPEREMVATKIAFSELQDAFADLAAALARLAPSTAETMVADIGAGMQRTLRAFSDSLAPEIRDDAVLQAAATALEGAIELALERMAEAAKTQ
ncbi:hypothetical protein [Aquabacter sp. CN5-332]|uniref:hypothetical protein n=1 Tax=Aquabacter sp. CN5-332 TaxID=3156608 RepID=UPI0032B5468B